MYAFISIFVSNMLNNYLNIVLHSLYITQKMSCLMACFYAPTALFCIDARFYMQTSFDFLWDVIFVFLCFINVSMCFELFTFWVLEDFICLPKIYLTSDLGTWCLTWALVLFDGIRIYLFCFSLKKINRNSRIKCLNIRSNQ